MNKNLASLLLSISVLTLLQSCSQIKIKTPSARFTSPEANGRLFSGKIQIQQTGGTEAIVDLSNDKLDNSLYLKNTASPIEITGEFGILKNLDLFIKPHKDSATLTGLKLQFIGPNYKEAKAGDHSMAFTIAGGKETRSDSDDDSFLLDDSNTDVEIEQTVFDTALIYGYRLDNTSLAYISINATKYDLVLNFNNDSNATLNNKEKDLATWAYGTAFGAVRYFDQLYLNLEVNAQNTNWDDNESTTFVFLNMSLGWRWD